MSDAPVAIHSLAELRDYVLRVLCEHENLISDQFSLQEYALTRRGATCGRQFLLQGPRSVRLGAVWASDRNDLYFYDARGERFRKERLTGAIAMVSDAA
jgi:hypothetical protein